MLVYQRVVKQHDTATARKVGCETKIWVSEIQGEYETLEGWTEDISGCLGGLGAGGFPVVFRWFSVIWSKFWMDGL